MANAFITQRIYQSGDTPQPTPTPTPTSSSPVKVWKAWQIGDTDFFIGVGQAVNAVDCGGFKFEYYSYSLNPHNHPQYSQGNLCATSVWGRIEDGKAKTIYEYWAEKGDEIKVLYNNSYDSSNNTTYKYICETGTVDNIRPEVYPYTGSSGNNGMTIFINGWIHLNGHQWLWWGDGDSRNTQKASFQFNVMFPSNPILLIESLYANNQEFDFIFNSTHCGVNYPTYNDLIDFLNQLSKYSSNKPQIPFNPIDIDLSIQGTLFNGLVSDPT